MILIDGIVFSLQRSGGISACFKELIGFLISGDVKFKFLSYGGNDMFDVSCIPEFQKVASKSPHYLRRLERYMDQPVPEDIKIFHSSYYRLPKNKNIKTVTTVHDFTYEYFEVGARRVVHTFQKRRAILNSDVVICISENTKNDLYKFIPEARGKDVRVIYNGVSPNYRILNCVDEPSTAFVLFVGARSGYKNFSCLVASLEHLPQYSLVCVGGGAFKQQELAQLDALIPGRYKHESYLTNEQLNKLYNQAFCLVYPSLYEGFGIPALEAMRAGCPVVAAAFSSLPEICADAAILLAEVLPETIKGAIESLEDKLLRESYILKGLKNSSRFSWEKNAQEIIGIYKELCGEARE